MSLGWGCSLCALRVDEVVVGPVVPADVHVVISLSTLEVWFRDVELGGCNGGGDIQTGRQQGARRGVWM